MSNWWWRADYLETCNCAHGCPCNLTMIPTHGSCEAVAAFHILEGECDGVSLAGARFATAFAWPGPIHRGHGRAVVYLDEQATPEQRAALERIATGEAGPGGYFEIFRSTCDERPSVMAGPMRFEMNGRRARLDLPALGHVEVGPIISDMDGSEANARLVVPDGFIFKDAVIANVDSGAVRGGGLEFAYQGSSAFISQVTYNA